MSLTVMWSAMAFLRAQYSEQNAAGQSEIFRPSGRRDRQLTSPIPGDILIFANAPRPAGRRAGQREVNTMPEIRKMACRRILNSHAELLSPLTLVRDPGIKAEVFETKVDWYRTLADQDLDQIVFNPDLSQPPG